MALIIGIGGITGSGKSTCARIFYDKLKQAGYNVGWPTKYVTRKRRLQEDPNTICVDSVDEIPDGFTTWDIKGKTVAYNIEEIKEMLQKDIWPIILSSSLDLLFDIKESVKIDNPILLQDDLNSDIKNFILKIGNLEYMRIIYTLSYYLSNDSLNSLVTSRSELSEEEIKKEVMKRNNERDFYHEQFLKYYSYVGKGCHTIISKIAGMENFDLKSLENVVENIIFDQTKYKYPLEFHDKINKFFVKSGNVDEKWLFDNMDKLLSAKGIEDQEKVTLKTNKKVTNRK